MRGTIATASWLVLATAGVVVLACRPARPRAATPALPRSPAFDRITARRIDVVEPDGKPRVIASTAAAYPGAYFNGIEYPHPDRDKLGGFLFFNDEGTEAGGWGCASRRDGHSYDAGCLLTMDQTNQNETLKLTYEESDGNGGAGLVVFGDHPKESLQPLLVAKTDAERTKLAESLAGPTPKRVFVGRMGGDAQLALADLDDVPRIVMTVPATGEPTIQFFDAAGKPTKTYSASK
jgi:hypothetical protein